MRLEAREKMPTVERIHLEGASIDEARTRTRVCLTRREETSRSAVSGLNSNALMVTSPAERAERLPVLTARPYPDGGGDDVVASAPTIKSPDGARRQPYFVPWPRTVCVSGHSVAWASTSSSRRGERLRNDGFDASGIVLLHQTLLFSLRAKTGDVARELLAIRASERLVRQPQRREFRTERFHGETLRLDERGGALGIAIA